MSTKSIFFGCVTIFSIFVSNSYADAIRHIRTKSWHHSETHTNKERIQRANLHCYIQNQAIKYAAQMEKKIRDSVDQQAIYDIYNVIMGTLNDIESVPSYSREYLDLMIQSAILEYIENTSYRYVKNYHIEKNAAKHIVDSMVNNAIAGKHTQPAEIYKFTGNRLFERIDKAMDSCNQNKPTTFVPSAPPAHLVFNHLLPHVR